MMNAVAGIFLAARRKKGWTNPYVTDGLVAMWDGEWNAGGGVHDPNATEWEDLSGRGHDLTSSSFRWTDNALDDSASNIRLDLGDLSGEFPSAITLEAVVRCPNYRNNAVIFDFYNHNNAGITLFTSNLSTPYGIRGQARNPTNNGYTAYYSCDAQYQATATFVWDNTGIRLYGFGSQKSSGATPTFVTPPVYYFLGASNSTYSNFRGYVNSIRIYSRALTAAEVAANYAVDKARFNLP